MKHTLYALALGLMIVVTGCEDKLDIEKHGNMGGQTEFYQTDEETLQATASLFSTWSGTYYNWFMTKNCLSDDVWAGGGSRGDNSQMEMLNEFTFDTDHGMVQSLYSGFYAIIYKANLIIAQVEPDTQVKAQSVAEARFFRAWSHFELATLFGTAPVVDHLLAPSEYRKGNSTTEELWAAVENDLNEALASGALPSKSSVDDEATTIRVTREVAQAMLGKAYLFQGKYAEAAKTLDAVIASGKYDLYQGDLDKITHVAANNCESMLECQKRNDSEQAWNQLTMTYLMMGWRTDKLNMTAPATDYIASGTYGFMNPRRELYDAFVAEEGTDGYRLKSTIRTIDQIAAIGVTVQPGANLVGHDGLFDWKYRTLKEDCIMDASYFQALQYINLRVMRYAEVLLLAAEAHVQNGDAAGALPLINKIRTRARLAPLATVTLDDVKREKRLELCMESVRFQDLVRWGDAAQALANQGREVRSYSAQGVEVQFTNPNGGFKPKNMLLPIPRKEIELNPNMTQNPEW